MTRGLERVNCRSPCIMGDTSMMQSCARPLICHRRAQALAAARGQSMSATVAELTARGLSQLDEPISISTDERSGFPVISVGRLVTSQQVADLLDEV